MVVNKSKSAFRTIAEVADDLGVATHVLRFWETKFNQIKPMKASGGRRYYRPDDVEVLKLIKGLFQSLRDEKVIAYAIILSTKHSSLIGKNLLQKMKFWCKIEGNNGVGPQPAQIRLFSSFGGNYGSSWRF